MERNLPNPTLFQVKRNCQLQINGTSLFKEPTFTTTAAAHPPTCTTTPALSSEEVLGVAQEVAAGPTHDGDPPLPPALEPLRGQHHELQHLL